jgi:uracil-DNA glycosylase
LTEDPNVWNRNNSNKRTGHLNRWAEQGVLLLNAVFTVRDGQPNSHKNKGWEKVTDEIIRNVVLHRCSSAMTPAINCTDNNIPQGCVFLLWGQPAMKKAMNVIESSIHDLKETKCKAASTKTHKIISTSHPSPLGARKTTTPFLGSRCFSRCNEALIQMGHTPIDWNVD